MSERCRESAKRGNEGGAGSWCDVCFFFNDTATTEIYTLSLHDALPIFPLDLYLIKMVILELKR